MSFIVGLTGGIGSGKTTVANLFAELGAALVDADQIAHQLTAADGAAMPLIQKTFGSSLIEADGGLNRVLMRRMIFADMRAKARLEAILHPLIRQHSVARCATPVAMQAPYVLLIVPLLLESGVYRQQVQRVLVVDCAEETQIKRVMARSALTQTEVEAIMSTQLTRLARLQAADDVIDNETDSETENAGAALSGKVHLLHQQYSQLAKQST